MSDETFTIVADPHALLATPDAIGTLAEVAARLKCSRRTIRDIVLGRTYSRVKFADVRVDGIWRVNTRRYCVADIAAVLPEYEAWRAEKRERGVALDAKRGAEARVAKAIRLASKPAKPTKGKPAPKQSATPKPRPQGPRSVPPLLARASQGRAPVPPTPEIYMARGRAAR